jgi:uncharacterized short protein YbdD (DUF466 family)
MMIFIQTIAIRIPRTMWVWLRQVSGDAAYDNYLRSMRRSAACDLPVLAGSAHTPLSREDFYLDALRRRYSTISRCC